MFDDEKIKLIRTLPDGEKIVMIWVQTMCHAGKIIDGGSVYMGQNLAYSDEMLATIFNQPLNVVRAAGAAPIYPGDPGFQQKFDRDNDGIGCE